jgi:hypothetical protein
VVLAGPDDGWQDGRMKGANVGERGRRTRKQARQIPQGDVLARRGRPRCSCRTSESAPPGRSGSPAAVQALRWTASRACDGGRGSVRSEVFAAGLAGLNRRLGLEVAAAEVAAAEVAAAEVADVAEVAELADVGRVGVFREAEAAERAAEHRADQ